MENIAPNAYETPKHPSQDEFTKFLGEVALPFNPAELPQIPEVAALSPRLTKEARDKVTAAIDHRQPQ